MTADHENRPAPLQPESPMGKPLRAIHIIFEAQDGAQTRLTMTPQGTFYLASALQAMAGATLTEPIAATSVPETPAPPSPEPAPQSSPAPSETAQAVATAARKRQNQLILSGKLKSKPEEGKYPDKQGNPTAHAVFAANAEGRDDAWMLSTTFIRASRRIALTLNQGDQITVEGYVNKHQDPEKMDMYTVFRFLNYPKHPQEG